MENGSMNDKKHPELAKSDIIKHLPKACGNEKAAVEFFERQRWGNSPIFVFIHTSPQYKRRAWVAIDGDSRGKQIISTLAEKYNDWPKEHFRTFNEPFFEKYFPPRFQNDVTNILTFQNSSQRKEGKNKLLQNVLTWAQQNPSEARTEFEQSAKEIISFLKEIEAQIA
jgi:hypothetical protein